MDRCTWSQMDAWDFSDSYDTSCRAAFTFTDGGPEENGIKFCCYCGKPIEVVMAEDDFEGDDSVNPTSIADHLQALGEGRIEPIRTNCGICEEIHELFGWEARGMILDMAEDWEEFSGSREFPVSSKKYDEFDAYQKLKLWSKRTKYGQSRRRLCLYLAQRFREIGEK